MTNEISVSFILPVRSQNNLERKIIDFVRKHVIPNIPGSNEASFKDSSILISNRAQIAKANVTKRKILETVKETLRVKSIRFFRIHHKPGIMKFLGLLPPRSELTTKKFHADVLDQLIEDLKEQNINAEISKNEIGIRSLVIHY